MLPNSRVPTHPGEMLVEEFLSPLGVTQVEFANHLGIPIQRVNEIVNGKRGVTPGDGAPVLLGSQDDAGVLDQPSELLRSRACACWHGQAPQRPWTQRKLRRCRGESEGEVGLAKHGVTFSPEM